MVQSCICFQLYLKVLKIGPLKSSALLVFHGGNLTLITQGCRKALGGSKIPGLCLRLSLRGFCWGLFCMKRETNDSEVNHLLSFDIKHIINCQTEKI